MMMDNRRPEEGTFLGKKTNLKKLTFNLILRYTAMTEETGGKGVVVKILLLYFN